MCTCITYKNGGFYFGRNMDLDYSFGEKVTVTPRKFPLKFRSGDSMEQHYAMIGMASGEKHFPLYAEAVNERGLCMAGLNFPENAFYQKETGNGAELASFELIPWVLGRCGSVEEAEKFLKGMQITETAFSPKLPSAPLHWMLADQKKCIVLEPVREGLRICENPFGVLTNNPPFEYHRMNLNNYLNLTRQSPSNRFAKDLDLHPCSQGMGAVGLPGDASSASRFVRAAFLNWNSSVPGREISDVAQVFHILDSTAVVRGTVVTEHGTYEFTTYSCCMNPQKGIYYYKTYENSRIRKSVLSDFCLDEKQLLYTEKERKGSRGLKESLWSRKKKRESVR